MRMKNYHGVTFIKNFHQRIKFSISEILSATVRGEFYAIGSECVKCIFRFLDCCVDIGEGQRGAE